MRSTYSKPIRVSEESSSCAADSAGQNSHHSLLATTTSSRRLPAARNSSPNTTSEYPVGSGAVPVSSFYRASSRKSMPCFCAAFITASPCSRDMRSYVRQEPRAKTETSIPDPPSVRCSIAPDPTPPIARSSGGLFQRRCRLCHRLDREPREATVGPARERPGPAAEQLEHRGHEDAANDDRVEEDGGRHCDSEELEDAVVAGGKGGEDDDHHRGRGGDDAAGVGEPFAHRRARVAAVLPLLVDTGDEEDLVVHREPEHDCEDYHGDEGVDRPGLDADEAGE